MMVTLENQRSAICVSYLREMYRAPISLSKSKWFLHSGIRFREGVYYFGTNKFYLYKTEVIHKRTPIELIDLYSELSLDKPNSWFAFIDWCLYKDKVAEEFYMRFGRYIRHGKPFPLSFRRFIRFAMQTYPILDKEFPLFVIYCNRFVARAKNGGIKYKDREIPFNSSLFTKMFDLTNLRDNRKFKTRFQRVIHDLKCDDSRD